MNVIVVRLAQFDCTVQITSDNIQNTNKKAADINKTCSRLFLNIILNNTIYIKKVF
jgi:hypothetical protein